MEKFIVKGGRKLQGSVSVSGSKNMALKALVASCLTQEEVTINNVPIISDFLVMTEIIKEIGGEVKIKDHTVVVKLPKIKSTKISLNKAASIRTSSMFLAPLLVRNAAATIPNPGGCRIGARPIDRVIKGAEEMGVRVKYLSKDGFFHLDVKGKLKPIKYKFDKNTHTGTETLLLLSVLVKGKTILENAAQEPEVDDLIELLNKMGGNIRRTAPRTITIIGVAELHGAEFSIPPDRNEVVTLAVAANITQGDIMIKDINGKGLEEFIEVYSRSGGGVDFLDSGLRFYFKEKLKPQDIKTTFYPGFMTDWQGPWVVLMTQADGESVVHETVYENRFSYVQELEKMGANLRLFNPNVSNPNKFYNFNPDDNKAEYKHAVKITGPSKLHNAVLNITDLRAGATLVLASLSAEGESIIFGVEHLDRGYESFEKRLKKLGANIKRINK